MEARVAVQRMQGRMDVQRMEGRVGVQRTEGRVVCNGRNDGWVCNGWKDGWMCNGRKDGWCATDGRADGCATDGRSDGWGMEARVTVQRMDTSGLAHLLEAVELLQLVAQVLQRACHRRTREERMRCEKVTMCLLGRGAGADLEAGVERNDGVEEGLLGGLDSQGAVCPRPGSDPTATRRPSHSPPNQTGTL